jgi:predicted ATPase
MKNTLVCYDKAMNEVFIRSVRLGEVDYSAYPFSIPAIKDIEKVHFASPVTFFVGENGSGKSTITEAIAVAAGFNAEGGTKNYNFSSQNTTSSLTDNITLVRGAVREKYGYFLRAETFYTTANYADNNVEAPLLFDGKRIHEQSHGEAFLSIIKEFRPGLFIFDEPESALSPHRQLALLVAMHDLVQQGSQFIIATHSPILLAYPKANIYQLSPGGIDKAEYGDVEHVTLTRDFLDNPSRYLNRLLAS